MSYHVRVSEVDDNNIVLVGLDSLDEIHANLRSTHLRLEVIGSYILRAVYKKSCLVDIRFLNTAVKEECDMCILLCLSKSKLLKSLACDILTECILDAAVLKCDKLVRDCLIIILEAYKCKRNELSVKACELVIAECSCHFPCTVRTEVEEDN